MINNPDPYQIEPTPDQIRRMRHDEGLADHQRYFNVWEAILDEEWCEDGFDNIQGTDTSA